MKVKTLLIQEPSGQLMISPSVFKVYANHEYTVYESTFEDHFYIILRKRDNAIAMAKEYAGVTSCLAFTYKLEGSF